MRRGPGQRLAVGLATCGGLGHVGPAPGSLASLVGLGAFALLGAPLGLAGQLTAWGVLTLVGTWAAAVAAPRLGGPDPAAVVIDEFAAVWLAVAGLGGPGAWFVALALFRLFDVVKPFPARRLEGWRGGPGIMADDVVAALYAQGCSRLLLWWWAG